LIGLILLKVMIFGLRFGKSVRMILKSIYS
jgi:hypothetical protein